MEATITKTREQKIASLQASYDAIKEDNNFPDEFKAQGSMTECNFGGKLIIINNSGDAVCTWSDWSDAAIDEEVTISEIEYFPDPDADQQEEIDSSEEPAMLAGFQINDTIYYLNEFMRIDY